MLSSTLSSHLLAIASRAPTRRFSTAADESD